MKLAVAAFFAVGSCAGAEDPVVGLERQFFSAWQAKSLEAVEKNIAPEGVQWSEWGTFDKAAQIANQKTSNANCTVRSFAMKDVRVMRVSKDSAMLLYTVDQDAPCGAGAAPSPVANSSLWVKRGGRWVNVYRASMLPKKG
jgi:hypothetical protein